jgi:hypothetical protein
MIIDYNGHIDYVSSRVCRQLDIAVCKQYSLTVNGITFSHFENRGLIDTCGREA